MAKIFKSVHEQTIDDIVDNFNISGNFECVKKHQTYKIKGYVGEVDILAKLKGANNVYFIEVKTHLTYKSKRKAKEQFDKYKKAYPNVNVVGMLYVSTGQYIQL